MIIPQRRRKVPFVEKPHILIITTLIVLLLLLTTHHITVNAITNFNNVHFHSNPTVETGCLDFELKWTPLTTQPPENINRGTLHLESIPKYFRIVPDLTDSEHGAEYLRGHLLTRGLTPVPKMISIAFDDVTLEPGNSGTNRLPDDWTQETLYFRFGTAFPVVSDFHSVVIRGHMTITLCVVQDDCMATPIGWVPPAHPTDPTIIYPEVTPFGPTTTQIQVPIYHEAKYSIASFQRFNQWTLPRTPLIPSGPNTNRTMFELLLKDAFVNTITTHAQNRVDYIDIVLIGLFYFDIYVDPAIAIDTDPVNYINTHKLCYLNQVPVQIIIDTLQTRQIKVIVPNSLTTIPNDPYSYIQQIIPGITNRAQFTCNQNVVIRNDFRKFGDAEDIPLFIQIQLGYHDIDSQGLIHFINYPDRFSQFLDPSKLQPFQSPAPRVRNIATDYNARRSVISTSFLIEFSKTTGAMSGPLQWDTRRFLFYHTNFKLGVSFDQVTFDEKHFNPDGRTTQIRSPWGYVVLYFIPDVGYSEEGDWGQMATLTRVYQDPTTGAPGATFDFFSHYIPLDQQQEGGNGSGGMDVMGERERYEASTSSSSPPSSSSSSSPSSSTVSRNFLNLARSQSKLTSDNSTYINQEEFDIVEQEWLRREEEQQQKQQQQKQQPHHHQEQQPHRPQQTIPNLLTSTPYQRDTPFSPYKSWQQYSDTELPWETIPIHVMMKWYLPHTVFLSRFPRWTTHFELEHTDHLTPVPQSTMFELVTYFNATMYNATNAPGIPPLTTDLKDDLGVGLESLVDGKDKFDLDLGGVSSATTTISTTTTTPPPISPTTSTPITSTTPSLQDSIATHGVLRDVKNPGFAVNIHTIKMKNKPRPGLLTPEYRFPWDTLHSSSMQGKELYRVLGAQYQKFGIVDQVIQTSCLVQYRNGQSQLLHEYKIQAHVTNSVNGVFFTDWQYPALKREWLDDEFNTLIILCPDLYNETVQKYYYAPEGGGAVERSMVSQDEGSVWSWLWTTTSTATTDDGSMPPNSPSSSSNSSPQLPQFDPLATSQILDKDHPQSYYHSQHYQRAIELLGERGLWNTDEAMPSTPSSSPPPSPTETATTFTQQPPHHIQSSPNTDTTATPSKFSSCFYYEPYDPDAITTSKNKNNSSPNQPQEQFNPIKCDSMWGYVNQLQRHVRVHVGQDYPESTLNPREILLATWISIEDPFEMPTWAIVLIIIGTIVLLILGFIWWIGHRQRAMERKRHAAVRIIDGDTRDEDADEDLRNVLEDQQRGGDENLLAAAGSGGGDDDENHYTQYRQPNPPPSSQSQIHNFGRARGSSLSGLRPRGSSVEQNGTPLTQLGLINGS